MKEFAGPAEFEIYLASLRPLDSPEMQKALERCAKHAEGHLKVVLAATPGLAESISYEVRSQSFEVGSSSNQVDEIVRGGLFRAPSFDIEGEVFACVSDMEPILLEALSQAIVNG